MPCITLLSDFGLQDASVAIARGILMQHVPEAELVDITHLVDPFNIQQAAYLLLSAFPKFPKGSCHVLMFDIFSDERPRLMLCEHEGQYLLAPDNGILSLAFGDALENAWECYELPPSGHFSDWMHATARTISGLFNQKPKEVALKTGKLSVSKRSWRPAEDGNSLECHVIHIDRFENVVVNLTRRQFEEFGKGRRFRIQFMREEEITELSTHFFNVPEGHQLCRFNSTGFLEICINRGKAASLLGFKLYREGLFIYNTIKINFE
jgi:S-adenosylmethionine hydrolase